MQRIGARRLLSVLAFGALALAACNGAQSGPQDLNPYSSGESGASPEAMRNPQESGGGGSMSSDQPFPPSF